MSRLSLWLLRRTFRRSLERGHYHFALMAVLGVLFEEMQRKFYEDSPLGTYAAIKEQLDKVAEDAK